MQSNFIETLDDFLEYRNPDDYFFGEDTFDFTGLPRSDHGSRHRFDDDLFEESSLRASN
jgi:hypothetical protein